MSRPTSSANDNKSAHVSTRSTLAEPRQAFDAAEQPTSTVTNGAKPKEHIHDDTKTKNHIHDKKTLWVTVFKCFQCGKRGHKLPKCTQCSQAYYCNADCQRKHWKKHKTVCRAAVAALARRAMRERLARAVREKGKDTVEHSADDDLCVICQDTPVDAVEVSVLEVGTL